MLQRKTDHCTASDYAVLYRTWYGCTYHCQLLYHGSNLCSDPGTYGSTYTGSSFLVFYFGIVADITPPVALAAYAGSAIAKANPMKTAFTASKLAIAVFIVPYVFCFNPAMLLIDTTPLKVVQIFITSLIGVFGLSSSLEGFLSVKMSVPVRVLMAAGGLMLIDPSLMTDVVEYF